MDFDVFRKKALEELERVGDITQLEKWRVQFLGRKSELTLFLRGLAARPLAERKTLGREANALRQELEKIYQNRQAELLRLKPKREAFDVSRPGKKFLRGHLHPLTITLRQIIGTFVAMGFEVVEGPDIETEYYNFDALNIPSWHPARDLWDTFWIKFKIQNSKLLLRTHTSPVQIRYMETHQPPFRIIAPGKVFRHEATDARHEMEFFQLEGLMVGNDVSLANFKAIMEHALKEFFGPKTELQLRASYFPFTEPSVEVLMSCVICNGSGILKRKRCHVCGGERLLEMGGAGMVHPQVFRNVGYDPQRVQAFPFGRPKIY
jgi:phenylalanyl-tRNA synthetase alpha chain